ncbi:MAG: hypothetical protein GTN62_04420, partial [Gemmatimonadales bacterium]|nr:hypothetical protein [Gemmatimonadales bacterium]NIN49344.1 hypothetical protein [Gemmatimonadales bacterium]NIP06808.1 hypothetical protein [Gemmatimonadales bacterium]NIS65228.1 hypothetical protein [Gemmatimonadales bacterium]
MLRLRHQLPAYSPISLAAIGSATFRALGLLGDPRVGLSDYLRERYAAEAVVLYGSGTEALVDALRIAGSIAGRRATVAIPAFNCFNVAAAAVAAEVPISFYDLDPSTLNPDWESLVDRMADGARVVVTAPLYGIPVDHDTLAESVAAYGAAVIEDAAQGFGAAWRGRPLGALGNISVVSFGRGKGWTGGRGGALLLRG